jgi:hypothetical protein
MGISLSQGRYLHAEQHKHINNANIHALNGIRTHDPSVYALDRAPTVINVIYFSIEQFIT